MRRLAWIVWHAARFHPISIGRPYDTPVGIVAHCRCGHRRWLI